MATLHLPKKKTTDPLEVIAYDEPPEVSEYNSTINVPTSRSHVDYSHLPPPGERGQSIVQAPKKVWGNPRLFRPEMSPGAGPQPLIVPPKGR